MQMGDQNAYPTFHSKRISPSPLREAPCKGGGKLARRLAEDPKFKDAELAGEVELLEGNGFAGVLPLSGLQPETQYYYAVNLSKSHPAKSDFHSFTTCPEPSTGRSFSYMFGSCYLPSGGYGSTTFDKIHKHIASDDLRFGIFLGDQIYADNAERNGLGKIAVTLDDYRSAYAYAWSRPPMQKLLPDLPLFMILNDHEVEDDWRFDTPERNRASIPLHIRLLRIPRRIPAEQRHLPMERIRAALRAYYEHQAMHAPKMLLSLQTEHEGGFMFQRGEEGSFAYTFNYGCAAFFILDTRTMRVKKGKIFFSAKHNGKNLRRGSLESKTNTQSSFWSRRGRSFIPSGWISFVTAGQASQPTANVYLNPWRRMKSKAFTS